MMFCANTQRPMRAPDRRSIGVIGGLVLMMAVLGGPSGAMAQAVVDFSPAAGTVDCAEILYVDVTIDGTVTDLRGFSFSFGFDPQLVTPVSVAPGDLFTGAACDVFFQWTNETTFVNTIDVDGSFLGCSTAGPGTMIRIGFAPGPDAAVSALTTLASRVRDSANVDIAIVEPSGTVENLCNQAPVANDDSYTVAEGGTINAVALGSPPGVLDNDTDDDVLSATIVTGPLHATSFTLNLDGSFDYVNDGLGDATDSFVYAASDGQGGVTQATANITVTLANDLPVVTNPGPQSSTENEVVSLQIVATDEEQVDLLYTAVGLPGGLAIDLNTGEISGVVDCGAATGSPYSVTVDVDDQVGGVSQVVFAWDVVVQVAPPAIADLGAVQVKTGNDVDGTTAIVLTWSGVAPTNTVAVYRKGFGDYPEYDDGSGAVPTAPTTPALAAGDGWTLTAVTASGAADETVVRDCYYYVAFVLSECSTVSAVSNLAGGVLNYHLGDVSDGVTAGDGDNLVASEDVSLLGFHYSVDSLDGLYLNYLDVGPTTDFSPNGRPTTDNLIEFEDLMMFSLNYNTVSKGQPVQAPRSTNLLTMVAPGSAVPGETIEVPLHLQGDGRIHGISLALTWDASVVNPVGYAAGELLDQQGGPAVCYGAGPGHVDLAVFGDEVAGLTGEGVAATLRFEVLAAGDPNLGFGDLRVRGADNRAVELALQIDATTPVPGAAPAVSGLYGNYPNPFNPSTTLSFGIGASGRVSLGIYGVDGRLVRTVVDQDMVPGNYREVWNGTDERGNLVASGVYFVHLVASDRTESSRITLLK